MLFASADPTIGVNIRPTRLALALKLGATHVIDNRHEDIDAHIGEITRSGVNIPRQSRGIS